MALIQIFIFFLLQNALSFVWPSVFLPLMLAAVIFFGLSEGPRFGLAAGAWAGLLLESFATGKFGIQLTLWGSAGFISGFLSSKIFPDSFLVQVFLPVLMRALMIAANFLLLGSLASHGGFLSENFWAMAVETGLTAFFVFWFLRPRRHLARK